MKPAQDWLDEVQRLVRGPGKGRDASAIEVIEAIQRDVLDAAARIADGDMCAEVALDIRELKP